MVYLKTQRDAALPPLLAHMPAAEAAPRRTPPVFPRLSSNLGAVPLPPLISCTHPSLLRMPPTPPIACILSSVPALLYKKTAFV